jgi:signal transduction histidine kinase
MNESSWKRNSLSAAVGTLLVGTLVAIAIASGANVELLAFVLLGAFGIVAAVCAVLLIRLAAQTHDLTRANVELERANVELERRNAEVEEADRAKSRFLANMSHELRTPLNAIIGFADLMYDGRVGPLSEDHRGYLADIRGSAHHLLHLINEVLDLARIESGRMKLDIKDIEPEQIAAQCVDAVRPLAAENEITVALEALPVGIVLLDPARLRQVLLNYLSNAIKFTPSGGEVKARLRREGTELVIEVADTGPGIAREDQQRVFEEFEQLSQRRQGGTGLGLAVTKRIVEAQGGSVGLRSVVGEGSTFIARLPVVDGSKTITPSAVVMAPELSAQGVPI